MCQNVPTVSLEGALIAELAHKEQWCSVCKVDVINIEGYAVLVPFVQDPLHKCRVAKLGGKLKWSAIVLTLCVPDLVKLPGLVGFFEIKLKVFDSVLWAYGVVCAKIDESKLVLFDHFFLLFAKHNC
jgi:hypothetical protein